jgi:hypothetical protein
MEKALQEEVYGPHASKIQAHVRGHLSRKKHKKHTGARRKTRKGRKSRRRH